MGLPRKTVAHADSFPDSLANANTHPNTFIITHSCNELLRGITRPRDFSLPILDSFPADKYFHFTHSIPNHWHESCCISLTSPRDVPHSIPESHHTNFCAKNSLPHLQPSLFPHKLVNSNLQLSSLTLHPDPYAYHRHHCS